MKSVLSKFGLVLGAFCALGAMGCDGSSEGDGGGSGTGGTSGGTGGATGEPGVELLTDEVKMDGWIGGVPEDPTDDPKGIQGAIYIYGDEGVSCELVEGNPCTIEEGCCLSGQTVVDETYTNWGCGIGISLNDTGGDASMKLPYKGTATAFNYTITGSSAAQVRVGFTQFADTTGLVSPYAVVGTFDNGIEGTVTFDDAKYQNWCGTNAGCLLPPDRTQAAGGESANPMYAHDIQFQVAGGDDVSDFNFCITSLEAVE